MVSVIIPTYNRKKALRRAVESVFRQTYEKLEIIIVDDASDYNVRDTVSTLEQEKNREIILIEHDINKGGAAARNTGIKKASGEYIAFLDDDDRWIPEKIELQVEHLENEDEDVGVVYTGRYVCDQNGNIKNEQLPPNIEANPSSLLCWNFVGTFSGVLIKREALLKVGGLDERFPSWQDQDLYIRISIYYDFSVIQEPLVIYQSGNDSITGNYEQTKNETVPLFMEKYSDFARSIDWVTYRKMRGWSQYSLGVVALNCGFNLKSLKHFLVSIRLYPFQYRFYAMMFISISRIIKNSRF